MTSLKKCIKLLTSENPISKEDAASAMHEIMSGGALPSQIGGFLCALTLKKATADVVSALAAVMRDHALSCSYENAIDVVGTGGDGFDTFNISTTAALVVAGAGGIVAKHGNRSSSSACGSADLLEKLGARIDVSGEQVPTVLKDSGFCFLFARKFHPSMRHAGPIRSQLGCRTIFNILGPLTNPCKPRYQLSGVFDKSLGPIYIEAMKQLGIERAIVVHGHEGLDEISIAGPTYFWKLEDSKITHGEICPEDFGLPRHPLSDCPGGSPDENLKTFHSVINGDEGPVTDFVLLNAAAALYVCEIAKDFKDGVRIAREAIASGKVRRVVEAYVKSTNDVFEQEEAKDEAKEETIIETISKQRIKDIEQIKSRIPMEDLMASVFTTPPPSCISVMEKLKGSKSVAIMAEIKRASPSKGDIFPDVDIIQQALSYAEGGAAVISVLTEPKWFKGSITDLFTVRKELEKKLGSERPAVLLKDFVLDEYQIYQARTYGADTILLIVQSLTKEQLQKFIKVSRTIGMEPLVEVNSAEEMRTALEVGSKVIGVNNRDLKTFEIDMGLTKRLAQLIPEDADVILCAFSGISTREHVEHFVNCGAKACLVGESLMRSANPVDAVRVLRGEKPRAFVKICGIRDLESALVAADNEADFISMIFVPNTKRCISIETGKHIVDTLKEKYPKSGAKIELEDLSKASPEKWFASCSSTLTKSLINHRPLFVGVFLNQEPEEINKIASQVGLDIIQLHGNEGFQIADELIRPVFRVVHISSGTTAEQVLQSLVPGHVAAILLDTKIKNSSEGGTGVTFDWNIAKEVSKKIPVIVAGGLTPTNVEQSVIQISPWCVDVSSGTETDGVKDHTKIIGFIKNAKLK